VRVGELLREGTMARDDPSGFHTLPQPAFGWLDERHRRAIVAHLSRLDSTARVRRFGRALAEPDIAAFVEDIDFRSHWLIGAFSFDHRLIALAHACPVRSFVNCTVYAAISVDADQRGRGIGRALLGSIVDRIHQVAGTSVVAIGSAFEFADDAQCDVGADGASYDLCTGLRIEAERLPPGRAYRDTIAQAAMR
jgi:GNAT superfamily N-acetyltransferase